MEQRSQCNGRPTALRTTFKARAFPVRLAVVVRLAVPVGLAVPMGLIGCEATRAQVDGDMLAWLQQQPDTASATASGTDVAPAAVTSTGQPPATTDAVSATDAPDGVSATDVAGVGETVAGDTLAGELAAPDTSSDVASPADASPATDAAPAADAPLPSADAQPIGSDAATDAACATCPGTPAPAWSLVDFQPKSAGFKSSYGLSKFVGKVTVVAFLASW